MRIIKKVQGRDVILEYKKIKSYLDRFTTYRVYKVISKSKRVFLYNTCLTSSQLQELVERNYIITDEEVFE